tara:strand:- start:40 stop:414 length:375 start_codon:yes stop_codon:yes gene_type:complete
MYEYFIWFLFFLLGVSFNKAFSFLTAVGYTLQILKGSEIISLRMVSKISDDVEFLREVKYQTLKDAGVSEGKIEVTKAVDDQIMKSWKELVIKNIITSFPDSYKGNLEYQDWLGADRYLKSLPK